MAALRELERRCWSACIQPLRNDGGSASEDVITALLEVHVQEASRPEVRGVIPLHALVESGGVVSVHLLRTAHEPLAAIAADAPAAFVCVVYERCVSVHRIELSALSSPSHPALECSWHVSELARYTERRDAAAAAAARAAGAAAATSSPASPPSRLTISGATLLPAADSAPEHLVLVVTECESRCSGTTGCRCPLSFAVVLGALLCGALGEAHTHVAHVDKRPRRRWLQAAVSVLALREAGHPRRDATKSAALVARDGGGSLSPGGVSAVAAFLATQRAPCRGELKSGDDDGAGVARATATRASGSGAHRLERALHILVARDGGLLTLFAPPRSAPAGAAPPAASADARELPALLARDLSLALQQSLRGGGGGAPRAALRWGISTLVTAHLCDAAAAGDGNGDSAAAAAQRGDRGSASGEAREPREPRRRRVLVLASARLESGGGGGFGGDGAAAASASDAAFFSPAAHAGGPAAGATSADLTRLSEGASSAPRAATAVAALLGVRADWSGGLLSPMATAMVGGGGSSASAYLFPAGPVNAVAAAAAQLRASRPRPQLAAPRHEAPRHEALGSPDEGASLLLLGTARAAAADAHEDSAAPARAGAAAAALAVLSTGGSGGSGRASSGGARSGSGGGDFLEGALPAVPAGSGGSAASPRAQARSLLSALPSLISRRGPLDLTAALAALGSGHGAAAAAAATTAGEPPSGGGGGGSASEPAQLSALATSSVGASGAGDDDSERDSGVSAGGSVLEGLPSLSLPPHAALPSLEGGVLESLLNLHRTYATVAAAGIAVDAPGEAAAVGVAAASCLPAASTAAPPTVAAAPPSQLRVCALLLDLDDEDGGGAAAASSAPSPVSDSALIAIGDAWAAAELRRSGTIAQRRGPRLPFESLDAVAFPEGGGELPPPRAQRFLVALGSAASAALPPVPTAYGSPSEAAADDASASPQTLRLALFELSIDRGSTRAPPGVLRSREDGWTLPFPTLSLREGGLGANEANEDEDGGPSRAALRLVPLPLLSQCLSSGGVGAAPLSSIETGSAVVAVCAGGPQHAPGFYALVAAASIALPVAAAAPLPRDISTAPPSLFRAADARAAAAADGAAGAAPLGGGSSALAAPFIAPVSQSLAAAFRQPLARSSGGRAGGSIFASSARCLLPPPGHALLLQLHRCAVGGFDSASAAGVPSSQRPPAAAAVERTTSLSPHAARSAPRPLSPLSPHRHLLLAQSLAAAAAAQATAALALAHLARSGGGGGGGGSARASCGNAACDCGDADLATAPLRVEFRSGSAWCPRKAAFDALHDAAAAVSLICESSKY